jgi:D-lactate dehydrogenase
MPSSASIPHALNEPLTDDLNTFIAYLKQVVGAEQVLTEPAQTQRFRTGYRFGTGRAIAVVQPGSLLEQWQVVKACIAANKIIIMQAANTGLTGGSTPDGNDYDRDIVIINTMRMRKIQLILEGRQVVCLPGSTLDQLERELKAHGREPHSVIGSSCIGASVLGGVCNNSGGSLIQRGPAYTEMALYARLDEQGQIHLVNHLGINLGTTPEEILTRLEAQQYSAADIILDAGSGSDQGYTDHVRKVDAETPARFNADTSRLYEASGSAGKLAVFAVRLDTFPMEKHTAVFYIGTNDTAELTEIRRHMLADFSQLPISGEYMHRDAFDIAEVYGKDTFMMIDRFGTQRLPKLFALKSRFDTFFSRFGVFPVHLTDRILQAVSRLFPSHLPKRMKQYRDVYEHHLLLKVGGELIEETQQYLDRFFSNSRGGYFKCTAEEGRKAFLHRFAAAGAAVRYRDVHPTEVEDIVALDIALRRNDRDWFEQLPADIEEALVHKLYYGHFFCHVFHQDYIVKKGRDCLSIEHRM